MLGVLSSQGELEMDPARGAPRPGESQAHTRWVSARQGNLGSWRVHTGLGTAAGDIQWWAQRCVALRCQTERAGDPHRVRVSVPRLGRCQEDLGDTCPWRAPVCATDTCWKTGLFAEGFHCGIRGGE